MIFKPIKKGLFGVPTEILVARAGLDEGLLKLLNADFDAVPKVRIEPMKDSNVYSDDAPGPGVQWITPDRPIFQLLVNELDRIRNRFVHDQGREWVGIRGFETPRYNLYRKGIGYSEHVDMNKFHENPALSMRYASVVIGLNDEYKGGLLKFPRQGVSVKIGKGDIVIFPSGYTHPHGVTPVTEGERKTLVCWFQ